MNLKNTEIKKFRQDMLSWYDLNRRAMPWRALEGKTPNPYYVWLSEVMLQQTTVQAVIPYFLKFIKKWPKIEDLASASVDDVTAAWAGLGYYARARNLHKCAQLIVRNYNGIFPNNQAELKKLPGIGDYTSAAIASIAFDRPASVVDGNVERVLARYFALVQPMPYLKKDVKAISEQISGQNQLLRPGDFAQSMMDLGATVCTPKSPKCPSCPLKNRCLAFNDNIAESFPRRIKAKDKPVRVGIVYICENSKGEYLIERRSEKGLLGGMLGFPCSEWAESNSVKIKGVDSVIMHSFTHFNLYLFLNFLLPQDQKELDLNGVWVSTEALIKTPMPSVFEKVKKMVLLKDAGE